MAADLGIVTKKVGPLPMWTYAVILGGALFLFSRTAAGASAIDSFKSTAGQGSDKPAGIPPATPPGSTRSPSSGAAVVSTPPSPAKSSPTAPTGVRGLTAPEAEPRTAPTWTSAEPGPSDSSNVVGAQSGIAEGQAGDPFAGLVKDKSGAWVTPEQLAAGYVAAAPPIVASPNSPVSGPAPTYITPAAAPVPTYSAPAATILPDTSTEAGVYAPPYDPGYDLAPAPVVGQAPGTPY